LVKNFYKCFEDSKSQYSVLTNLEQAILYNRRAKQTAKR
jgi:hypothetical protein